MLVNYNADYTAVKGGAGDVNGTPLFFAFLVPSRGVDVVKLDTRGVTGII